MFDSFSKVEISTISISLIAIGISAFNLYYTRKRTNNIIKYQDKDFNYKKEKDKEDFISKFKDEIHEFRIGLLELKATDTKISYDEKDKYMYLVESKYSIDLLKKYLGDSLYKEYLDITNIADETLNAIIYKKDFSNVFSTNRQIRYFFEKL